MSARGPTSTLLLLTLLLSSAYAKYSSRYKEADYATTTPSDRRVEDRWPVRVFNCVGGAGLQKCLKIFLVRRLDRVEEAIAGGNDVSVDFDVVDEIRNDFQWEKYRGLSDGELNGRIFRGFRKVFDDRNTTLVLHPGIDVGVVRGSNGSMVLNIKKDPDLQVPRGMKFPKKAFYRIVPMLLIPPLIMSAILPFVLPAMKILIVWVGMINQMALMGAIFTLMRNNAFQDKYEKKVIYVNEGYKNEKKPPRIVYHHEHFHEPNFNKAPHHGGGPPQFPHFSTGGHESFGEEFHGNEQYDDSYHPHHIPVHNFDDGGYERAGVESRPFLRGGTVRNKVIPTIGIH